MPTNKDRIIAYLARNPEGTDDDELSARLGIYPRQQVNQICRMLVSLDVITRQHDVYRGKIVNRLTQHTAAQPCNRPADRLAVITPVVAPTAGAMTQADSMLRDAMAVRRFAYQGECVLSEDEVKRVVSAHLQAQGWQVSVRFGKEHGIDIEARRGSETFVVEAKGEGSRDPMRVNYFLASLGELLQRMDSPDASYALAFPAHRQFVGLVLRLPVWIRQHLRLHFLLVRPTTSGGYEVGIVPPEVSFS